MTKAVTAIVKKELHASAEDKYATLYNTQAGYPLPQTYTSAILYGSDFHPLLPVVNQGVGGNLRLGNKIAPKALVVKFTLTMTGSQTTNSSDQLWGRLFVLKSKSEQYTPRITSTINPALLLDISGGNTQTYNGFPTDNNWMVNRREFTVVKDKLIKFQRGFGTLPQAANIVPYIGDQIYTSPNATHQLTVRIPCPKTLVYANNGDQYPTNFAPFFCFGYNAPQGPYNTTPETHEMDYRIAINWISHFTYEDE